MVRLDKASKDFYVERIRYLFRLVPLLQSRQGKQRFLCREEPCDGRTFILDYSYAGQSKQVKKQIIDMAVNGSGIRDTARVLKISTSTVIKEIKKRKLK